MTEKAPYTHGHHTSVVSTHSRRTAQDSASFLLPHLLPHHKILDLGCGPGSITLGLARLVPQGHVTGGDISESVLDSARALAASQNITNVTFEKLDGNALPYPDGSFDVVYAHQTLQHVADPVGVMREMRRVTKKGGVVAARDADYGAFAWYPESEAMSEWQGLYVRVARGNGAQPHAGRYLGAWAREAGWKREDVVFSWGVWNYQDKLARAFGRDWVDRALYSAFAKQAVEMGVCGREDLERVSAAWGKFSESEGAVIVIPSGEVLCFVR